MSCINSKHEYPQGLKGVQSQSQPLGNIAISCTNGRICASTGTKWNMSLSREYRLAYWLGVVVKLLEEVQTLSLIVHLF